MKPLFPLTVPLVVIVCCLALVGCGGSPQSFRSPAAQPIADAPPAPANASPSAPAAAAPAPTAAPAPANPQPPAPAGPATAAQADGGGILPQPPGDAKVFDQIQSTSDNWKACSVCAFGTNSTDNYWMAQNVTSPSMSGNSRELYVGGPQWTNALYIKTLPAQNQARHFLFDFWVYFDPASAEHAWTAEYDFWQSVNGREFMIGSQCNFGDGWWDTWDSKNNKWIHTTIRCERFTPEKWHHIQWYGERPDDGHYRYVSLVVDGKSYWVDQVFQVNPIDWADSMGVQWQLDQDMSGHDLHEWIDNVKLTVW